MHAIIWNNLSEMITAWFFLCEFSKIGKFRGRELVSDSKVGNNLRK